MGGGLNIKQYILPLKLATLPSFHVKCYDRRGDPSLDGRNDIERAEGGENKDHQDPERGLQRVPEMKEGKLLLALCPPSHLWRKGVEPLSVDYGAAKELQLSCQWSTDYG